MNDIKPAVELKWTQELPKVDGYYFILFPFYPIPALEKVSIESNGEVFGFDFSGEPGGTWYNEQNKYWYYGPIPVPAIPAELMASHPMLNSTGNSTS